MQHISIYFLLSKIYLKDILVHFVDLIALLSSSHLQAYFELDFYPSFLFEISLCDNFHSRQAEGALFVRYSVSTFFEKCFFFVVHLNY